MLLEIQDLKKSFGGFQALNGVNLHVNTGEIYGFLGPNGAGKSTTLRILLGLVYPDSGSIKINGSEILYNQRREYLAQVGALIERPDFYGNLSARNNLKILAHLSNIPNPKKRIDEVLDMVGLLPRGDSKFKTFSQGMKQRLGIAQTVLHNPNLVILDEPSNGLDPQGQQDMLNIIRTINSEMNKTVIFSTHILKEVESTAHRMVIINKGKNIVEGEVKKLMEESSGVVEATVDKSASFSELLSREKISFTCVESQFRIEIQKEQIPLLVQKLMDSGIHLFELKQVKTLENYFLEKVKS